MVMLGSALWRYDWTNYMSFGIVLTCLMSYFFFSAGIILPAIGPTDGFPEFSNTYLHWACRSRGCIRSARQLIPGENFTVKNFSTNSIFSAQPHLRHCRRLPPRVLTWILASPVESHDPLNVTICHPRQDFTFGREVWRRLSTLDSRSQVNGDFHCWVWSENGLTLTLVLQFDPCWQNGRLTWLVFIF